VQLQVQVQKRTLFSPSIFAYRICSYWISAYSPRPALWERKRRENWKKECSIPRSPLLWIQTRGLPCAFRMTLASSSPPTPSLASVGPSSSMNASLMLSLSLAALTVCYRAISVSSNQSLCLCAHLSHVHQSLYLSARVMHTMHVMTWKIKQLYIYLQRQRLRQLWELWVSKDSPCTTSRVISRFESH